MQQLEMTMLRHHQLQDSRPLVVSELVASDVHEEEVWTRRVLIQRAVSGVLWRRKLDEVKNVGPQRSLDCSLSSSDSWRTCGIVSVSQG